ncbi:hypothetical protein MNBD_BACTEROID03-544 [hydrothermal vent metagenome]|uniref:Uncharacterized protein n=1 Tax=hydrothermal vent metagenome TaxID=652676 RepID=A0A3B0U143_9ZZZZ
MKTSKKTLPIISVAYDSCNDKPDNLPSLDIITASLIYRTCPPPSGGARGGLFKSGEFQIKTI